MLGRRKVLPTKRGEVGIKLGGDGKKNEGRGNIKG